MENEDILNINDDEDLLYNMDDEGIPNINIDDNDPYLSCSSSISDTEIENEAILKPKKKVLTKKKATVPPAPPPAPPPEPAGKSNSTHVMKKGQIPPPPPAPASKSSNQFMESLNRPLLPFQTGDLIRQKQKLRFKGEKHVDVVLKRKDFLETSHGNLGRSVGWFIKELNSSNVTILDFSGTEQMTDMFWYMVSKEKVNLKFVKRLSLNGCHRLTDAAVSYMIPLFTSLNYVEFCGVKNLTEESLVNIITNWEINMEMINMTGNNIGIIPNKYQGSVRVNGCPVLSPVEVIYNNQRMKMSEKMNRSVTEWNTYKVVIVPDDTLPWSFMKIITGEKNVETSKTLDFKTGLNVGKSKLNLFEVPINSGFVDVVLSKGSIVIIPYLLAEDGPDPDYTDDIVTNMVNVFTTCPQCIFVITGITTDTGNLVNTVAERYFNVIKNAFRKKTDELNKSLEAMTESKIMTEQMPAHAQQMFMRGQSFMKCRNKLLNIGTRNIQDNPLLIPSIIKLPLKDDKYLPNLIKTAQVALQSNFPWYFLPHQKELSDILEVFGNQKLPLSSVEKITEQMNIPSNGLNALTKQENLTPYVAKMLELLSTMGEYMYYPELNGGFAMSDYTLLKDLYQTLMTNPAPQKICWRYFGKAIPCWLKKDLMNICPNSDVCEAMLNLLLDKGILLQLPHDAWTSDLTDTSAYICVKDLPYYPTIDIEELWPNGLPSDEIEVERYFYFRPGISETVFPSILSKCVPLGGIRVMWNKGIIIQKGPITVLIEQLNNHDNTSVIFIGARMMGEGKQIPDMLWYIFTIYKRIIQALTTKLNIFTEEMAPCHTCHPPRNRYKTVNSQSGIWMISDRQLSVGKLLQSTFICQNDGSTVDPNILRGPSEKMYPTHYYLGCLPSFSAYNRCMFCKSCAFGGAYCKGNLKNGKTSLNCSCDQEGQMCGDCGMCQRCIMSIVADQSSLYYLFSTSGSIISLAPDGADPPTQPDEDVIGPLKQYTCQYELSPNYCPIVELIPVRGSQIEVIIKMGTIELVYDTSKGSITERMAVGTNTKELKSQSNDSWICKEGYRTNIELKFSEDDMDDMYITFRVRDMMIYKYNTSTQSCILTLIPANPISLVIYTPKSVYRDGQQLDDFGEKMMCSYNTGNSVLPSVVEASLLKGKQFVETTLFQSGGVNYSGSSYISLPEKLTMDIIQYPSMNLYKNSLSYNLLCYTRSKIADVLSFSGTQAVPEAWSVYRMIHIADHSGLVIEKDQLQQLYQTAGELLWGWISVYKMLPFIQLPGNVSKFLPEELLEQATMNQIQAGLQDLLDFSYWNIVTKLGLNSNIFSFYEESIKLLAQSQELINLTSDRIEEIGLCEVPSKFNAEHKLYLCPGHHASLQVEEGLTQVLPEIYGDYAVFLLSVDLPSNQIAEIPENMFLALPNLAEFDCANNFIEYLPNTISACKKLYSLTLSENNLTDLPNTLTQCKELVRIDISSNMMAVLPPVVTKLTILQRLYANNMFLTSLPEDIGNLVNLEKLYINGNCFTQLPKSFANLKSLNDLSISGVPWLHIAKSKKVMSYENFVEKLRIWRLDRWLEAHSQERTKLFQFFDADRNLMLDFDEMGQLNAALFHIFPRFGYKGQEMPEDDTPSGFPMEILECRNLEYLNIYYQGIVSVPPEIGNLQDLKILNVSHNPNLLSVAAEVGTISSLNRLELEACPLLKTPPKEIRAKGFSTTFAYLRRLMSGSTPCKRTKLMLVGLGGAGKTSLVNALLSKDGKADLKHGEAITDGIDISTWTVKFNDEQITYSVWDFAGQTVYYNTHQFFLSNRAVYLLLWNVRLGHEHAGLDFWLSSISVQAPKAPIFVIGSHVDQVSKFELPINEMRQRYKQIAGFHFVSSYTGQGIKDLQENLFDVTLQEQYMGEQIPEAWLTFENAVIEARSSTNVMEYSSLEKLANISGIFDKSEVTQSVQFLHELGSLQHFTTENLKSKVVVNPQWIVDVMACVVSVKNSPIQHGRLKHSDIDTVWKDYPTNLHDWLLKLTEEYDLTFRLQDEPVNLVPCLLPEKAPEFTWPEVDRETDIKQNKLIYKFDYLPAGLFNRGQVRLHQISDSALIWKRGSFLKKNGHIALLLQTRDSELIVQVQGPRPENVIFLVHEVFEGLIAESFRGVKYDYLIPCPDCLKMYVREPHMFKASTIRRALEAKAPFLQCIEYFHTISCVDLLATMPPDNHSDFDLHLVQSVRNLRDLRKDLSADIFMSYCSKDAEASPSSVIHPETVRNDLVAIGYKCWFPERKKKHTIDELARALTDASVFIAFVSTDYARDEDCVNIFKYARLTLRKPMVVIAVGDGFEWKQSKLGILLADEVFVNMIKSKKGVYKTKFDELVNAISSKTNKPVGVAPTPSCFFSYTWVNSSQAVNLGTRAVSGALGSGDPREIKQYLEDNGIKCWIDVERVGKNGLFDDIAEGLLSARVVIVCVSDEYADSSTCRMEFRYAANTLKLPIILAVVGTGSKWRMSEVGVLSLRYPIVSFQEKSETAYSTLLSLIKDQMKNDETQKNKKIGQNDEHKNMSFQELFELAQRKLLRQLSLYADLHDVDVYPRLFIVDFIKVNPDEDDVKEKSDDDDGKDSKTNDNNDDSVDKPKKILKRQLSKRISELKSNFRVQRYCVYTLCEHDEGWHSVCEPIQLSHEFGESMLDRFSPFIARMTAIMKYNKHFTFNCLQQDAGNEYLERLDENQSSDVSDYREIYQEFRQLIIDADKQRIMGKLARCRLPNGKTIWLCDKHRESMKVTVLSSDIASSERSAATTGSDNMHMVVGLRSGKYQDFHIKFTSSTTAKRRQDIEGKAPVKTDMYTPYELLPDKKTPKPKISKKKEIDPKMTSKPKDVNVQETAPKKDDAPEVENSQTDPVVEDKKLQEYPVEAVKKNQANEIADLSNIQNVSDTRTKKRPGSATSLKKARQDASLSVIPEKDDQSKTKDIEASEGLGTRAKTFYGTPTRKTSAPGRKGSKSGNQQDLPKLERSKTTVEKPKSKTCVLM
ncbi:hypothetical protein ACF0H5_013728 [Mactra antiquata]